MDNKVYARECPASAQHLEMTNNPATSEVGGEKYMH